MALGRPREKLPRFQHHEGAARERQIAFAVVEAARPSAGRIKDLLIVYGRNHSPDDIEATSQEITGGRVAALAVPDEGSEQLVVIVEVKKRGASDEDVMDKFAVVKREVTLAISNSHGLGVADLVLVPPGSIPITTSGKVRRAARVEQYRDGQFVRWTLRQYRE